MSRRARDLLARVVPATGSGKHAPGDAEMLLVESMYGGTEEMEWAGVNGVHPGTREIGRIVAGWEASGQA